MSDALSLTPRKTAPRLPGEDGQPDRAGLPQRARHFPENSDRMLPILIEQSNQRCLQRLRDAFAEFSAADTPQKTLEIDSLDQLPPPDRIRLPYEDAQFDWIGCHGLIEHYSSHERQVRFLRELLRISRKGVFVSTPNREHPLVRWIRPGRDLALLDALDIKSLVDVLPGRPSWKLGHVRLYGLKAHYYLMIWKPGVETGAPSQ